MKKLIALLLALMLALALAVPASAAGEDIGIIGGADGLTYILVGEDQGTAPDTIFGTAENIDWDAIMKEMAERSAAQEKEQREQNIKALGGVAGQVNVLLGDRCIAFTDAVPEVKNGRTMVPLRAALEAMGARIEFDQATKTAIVTGEKASFTHVVGSDVITRADGSTVKMDVHSYVTPSNRTMVPVRFFSQVLGYDVFWDNGYRMVFLLDEETFAEKVDSRLTILNGYLAGNAKRFDASKNYKEDVTLSGTVKVIDSIKGDRSYPYSGKASVLMGGEGMSMSVSADLGDLAELLEGLGGKLPEAYRALTVKPELEAIFSDKLYFKSPLFDALMAKVDGTQAVSGAWYAADAAMSFADLRASMYGSGESYTVGGLLYASMMQGEANSFFTSWNSTTQLASAAAELLGDDTFTKSGSSYKWHFGKAELAKLITEMYGEAYAAEVMKEESIEELDIDLTLRGDGGVELKCAMAMDLNEEAAFRIDYTLTGNSSRMTVKGAVQLRNICDVRFDAAVSVRATSEKPLTAPPAGATIITLPPVMPIAA